MKKNLVGKILLMAVALAALVSTARAFWFNSLPEVAQEMMAHGYSYLDYLAESAAYAAESAQE
jgi:hypothetical protein